MTVYVVGDANGYPAWEIVGIYSSRALAERACTTEKHFVGPIRLDAAPVSKAATEWLGLYWPKKNRPKPIAL